MIGEWRGQPDLSSCFREVCENVVGCSVAFIYSSMKVSDRPLILVQNAFRQLFHMGSRVGVPGKGNLR